MQKALRDQIRAASDREAVIEPIPEWGLEIGLRPLSGLWRQAVLDTVAAASEKGDTSVGAAVEKMVPMLICQSAVDPADGKTLIFDEGDAEWIGTEKNGDIVHRVGAKILEISKLKALDIEASGNSSSATGSSGTGTSSRPSSEEDAQ